MYFNILNYVLGKHRSKPDNVILRV